MDIETLLLRSWAMGGGGPLGGVDWLTVLALLMVGLLYFLAPVFGYRTNNRGLLLASLWVLIGKMGLALLRVCILVVQRCSPLPCTQGRGVGGEGFGENERTSASFSLTRPSPPTPLP
jgi:hypothetical protein